MSDRTFEGNLKLVEFLANKYCFGILDSFDDMYQEGCIALLTAIKDYPIKGEPKGTRFSAFIATAIKFSMLKYKNKQGKLFLTAEARELKMKMRNETDLENASAKELAKKYNVKESVMADVLVELRASVSLDSNQYTTDEGDSLGAVIAGNMGISIIDDTVLRNLSEKEKSIFRDLFAGYTNREIADMRGVNIKRIIESRLYIRKKLGKEALDYHIRVV